MKTKEHIQEIIDKTFEVLQNVYENQIRENQIREVKSHIIFPKYRNNEYRLSEQELRFIFVEQFIKYCDNNNLEWFYSIETPTEKEYRFSDNNKDKNEKYKPRVCEENDKGQSAMIDLTIHDKDFNRIALIEFKAHNKHTEGFTKDLLKLREESKENDVLTYFIMYLESYTKATIESLNNKIEKQLDHKNVKYKKEDTNFFCYILDSKECFISKDNKIQKNI